MEELVGAHGQHVVLVASIDARLPANPFQATDFVAVVWACSNNFGPSERETLGKELIEAGARFIVCGGIDCEKWHDDADAARLELEPRLAHEFFVSTSWHTGESPEDVLFFAFYCTDFEDFEFNEYLVLVVGEQHAEMGNLKRAAASLLRTS